MKKTILILLAIIFFPTILAANCIKVGTITKITATNNSISVEIDNGKAISVLNPSRLQPGDFCKVIENNQGNFYLRKSGMPTGIILKTEFIKGKTLISFTNGRKFLLDGYQSIFPGNKIILSQDCNGKFTIVGNNESR